MLSPSKERVVGAPLHTRAKKTAGKMGTTPPPFWAAAISESTVVSGIKFRVPFQSDAYLDCPFIALDTMESFMKQKINLNLKRKEVKNSGTLH